MIAVRAGLRIGPAPVQLIGMARSFPFFDDRVINQRARIGSVYRDGPKLPATKAVCPLTACPFALAGI
jgi:hypothetical protein